MDAKRIEITVSEELWRRVEVARGHEPRASFVKRALGEFLARDPGALEKSLTEGLSTGEAVADARPSATPRASKEERLETGRQVLGGVGPKPFTPPIPKGGK